jgi:WD40 repeat protein
MNNNTLKFIVYDNSHVSTTTNISLGEVETEQQSARSNTFQIQALVNHILCFSDFKDLVIVSSVCKTLNVFATHTQLWKRLLASYYGPLLSGSIHVRNLKKFFATCYASEQALICPGKPSYKHTREFYSGEQTPLCIRFDQRHFMSGHIDKKVKIWDFRTGNLITELAGHTSWIKCLEFDDENIVTGSYDSSLREWSRNNSSCVAIFKGHGTNLNGRLQTGSPKGSVVCLHMDQNYIVSGSNDNTVRVWKRANIALMDANGNSNFGQNDVLSNNNNNEINIPIIQPTVTLSGHTATVRCIQFRGNVICSGGSDRLIRVWDIESGVEKRTLGSAGSPYCHSHRVSCLQMGLSGNPNLVISGSNDRAACLWDTRLHQNYGFVRKLKTHQKAVRRLQFDNYKLITGGDEPLIQCFDLRDGHGGSVLRYDKIDNSNELCAISSFSPCNDTDAPRVSAMQYDATHLACAFTLGHTDDEGNHHRYGSIKIWDMDTMMMLEEDDDDSMDGTSGSKYNETGMVLEF